MEFPPFWMAPTIADARGNEKNVAGMVFTFSKLGTAAYLPHLALMRILERAFIRAGIPFRLSAGFSKHITMELSQALSLGIASLGECALIQLENIMDGEEFCRRLQGMLPEGIQINRAIALPFIHEGRRCPSLGSLFASATYLIGLQKTAPLFTELTFLLQNEGGRFVVHNELSTYIQSQVDSKTETVIEYLLHKTSFISSQYEYFAIHCGPALAHNSVRQLMEPLLGSNWQSKGVQALRICARSHDQFLIDALARWQSCVGL